MKKSIIRQRYGNICFSVLSVLFLIGGCTSTPEKPSEQQIPLPRASTTQYRTGPFDQWIEISEVFPGDEAPAVIMHASGEYGAVGDWKTESICWVGHSKNVEVGYHCVRIQTRDYYEYDSGPVTVEEGYWPVDLNTDGLKDLLVVGWTSGDQGKHVKTSEGKRVYKRFSHDEPRGLRLIQRGEVKGAPKGIESDQKIDWSTMTEKPSRYIKHLQKTLDRCEEEKWRGRLRHIIQRLKSAGS